MFQSGLGSLLSLEPLKQTTTSLVNELSASATNMHIKCIDRQVDRFYMCVFVFAYACSIRRTLPRTSLLNLDGSKLELSYRLRWFPKNKKYKRNGLILIGGGKLKCCIFSIFYLKNIIPKFETHFSIRVSQEVLLIFFF